MSKKRQPYKRSPRRDELFYDAVASGLGVTEAAAAAGYSRRAAYNYARQDPFFYESWQDAKAAYVEQLEKEADRRAVKGVEDPVFYKGEHCGNRKFYSDTLMIFRLKGLDPQKYVHPEVQNGGAAQPVIVINRPDKTDATQPDDTAG